MSHVNIPGKDLTIGKFLPADQHRHKKGGPKAAF